MEETLNEILDEFDTVLAAKMAEQASPEAQLKAKRLYGRVRIVADARDMEQGDEYFIRIFNPSKPESASAINMLAKCYQTLMDEGKI